MSLQADETRAGFLTAMRRIPCPVALVVCSVDGEPWGVTISSFTSLSTAPPTVMVSLGSQSVAAKSIAKDPRISVNLLKADQSDLARYGSLPGKPKFLKDEDFQLDESDGRKTVRGALCALVCEVVSHYEVADHTLFIAQVTHVRLGHSNSALLYVDRHFHRIGPEVEASRAPEIDPFFDTLVHAV